MGMLRFRQVVSLSLATILVLLLLLLFHHNVILLANRLLQSVNIVLTVFDIAVDKIHIVKLVDDSRITFNQCRRGNRLC